MVKTGTQKNGLIELFRFLCSLWVAYFHGFSPILSDKFNGENVSTDFFFMISGFFFLKSIEKYIDKPFSEGIHFIFIGRTKRFIVPLTIAAFSVFLCNILFELDFNGFNWPLSFLWFFAAQLVFLSLYYILLKKIKRRSLFNIVCAIVICVCMSMHLLDLKQFDRVVRSPAMLALGMLISQIPSLKIELKDKLKADKLSLLINAVCFVGFAITFIYLAYLPGEAVWKKLLLCCLVCPAVLYFANALPVYSKFLNFLGELSLFIYLAQCPILIHHYTVSRDTRDQFPIFCICIVAMLLINRISNNIINKKKA